MPTEATDGLQFQANNSALTLNDLLVRATPQAIVRMAWAHDGSILAVGYESGLIELWDIGKRQVVEAIDSVGGAFAWSLLSRRLAWASKEALYITDFDSANARSRRLRGTDSVTSVSWSPDSTKLVFGTGQGHLAVLEESTDVIERVADVASVVKTTVWPHANRFLALISDGSLHSYSLETRGGVALDIEGVTSVTVSRDGSTIAAGTYDGRIRIWTSGQREIGTASGDLLGHNGPIRDLSFSLDGSLLASKAGDQRVIIWQLNPPGAVATIGEHPASDNDGLLFWSSAIAFSPAAPLLATSAQTVRLWNIDAKLLTLMRSAESDLPLGAFEPGDAPGLGSGRTSSAGTSRTDFYVHAPAATAGKTFTAKSADSYSVVLRGGVQVKERAHESALTFLAEHLRTCKVSIANPHPIDLLM